MDRLRRFWQDLTPGALILLALVAAGLWAFGGLADMVEDKGQPGFDARLLLAFRHPADLARPLGPPALAEAMRDLSALGSTLTLTLVALAVAGWQWLAGRGRAAVLMLVAAGGGALVSTLAKIVIARPRPEVVPHLTFVDTASFPSGHSMMSAVVYLTLAVVLAHAETGKGQRMFALGLAILLTLGVGVSRVYLGVHWPTDVLAGWALGAAWALAVWLIVGLIDRR
ncbi:MAG: phosphatase PAP2 family protein [Limimaricola sp.]|uniref:phosphatase PAP2 family protein n=1 Tax=Limimaricola sp. TaxID=2211665 RepID=UPI001D5DFECF|nr:phosphatase PAP2 family protein [Limimaricola sp.]MBI1417612.1 phosphatase PAP2 family protein [Limimaricola sp.]